MRNKSLILIVIIMLSILSFTNPVYAQDTNNEKEDINFNSQVYIDKNGTAPQIRFVVYTQNENFEEMNKYVNNSSMRKFASGVGENIFKSNPYYVDFNDGTNLSRLKGGDNYYEVEEVTHTKNNFRGYIVIFYGTELKQKGEMKKSNISMGYNFTHDLSENTYLHKKFKEETGYNITGNNVKPSYYFFYEGSIYLKSDNLDIPYPGLALSSFDSESDNISVTVNTSRPNQGEYDIRHFLYNRENRFQYTQQENYYERNQNDDNPPVNYIFTGLAIIVLIVLGYIYNKKH